MSQKIEGARFQIVLEQKKTWTTLTETSGTDSPVTRMNFFIQFPYSVPAQQGQVPAEAQSHRG